MEFNLIQSLQGSILANEILLKQYPSWKSSPKYNVKRGKAYQAYIAFKEQEQSECKAVETYNRPYDLAITAAKNELRKLLLSK